MGKWKKLRVNAIKESFDQLPTAVCFFDNLGGIVLCNRQMYRLSQYLFQSDMQYLGEVKIALASPPDGVVRLSDMEDTYRFPDKTVWQFEWMKVTDRYGVVYTQLTAADITELHRALVQLADDNRKLDEDAKKLRELSENVEAVAKEKELLAAKSAMHDSLAACITVTKQYLAGDLGEVDAGMVLQEWEKSIAFREAALPSLPCAEGLPPVRRCGSRARQIPDGSRQDNGRPLPCGCRSQTAGRFPRPGCGTVPDTPV